MKLRDLINKEQERLRAIEEERKLQEELDQLYEKVRPTLVLWFSDLQDRLGVRHVVSCGWHWAGWGIFNYTVARCPLDQAMIGEHFRHALDLPGNPRLAVALVRCLGDPVFMAEFCNGGAIYCRTLPGTATPKGVAAWLDGVLEDWLDVE